MNIKNADCMQDKETRVFEKVKFKDYTVDVPDGISAVSKKVIISLAESDIGKKTSLIIDKKGVV